MSSTSPISVARRDVSSSISARNDSGARASARASWRSVAAPPITEAIGPRSSCETSETKSARSAESRRSSSTAVRSASNARMFSTAVASWRPSRVRKSAIVVAERGRIAPRDGERPSVRPPERERRGDRREAEPGLGERPVLRVPRVSSMSPIRIVRRRDQLLDDGPADGPVVRGG